MYLPVSLFPALPLSTSICDFLSGISIFSKLFLGTNT